MSSPSTSLSRIPRPLTALLGLALAGGLLTGCMSAEDKINKLIDQEIKECRKAESTFYDVKLSDDTTKKVLAATCQEEVGEIDMPDEFTANIAIGPYTWTAGLDTETSIWAIQDVDWSTLDQAQNRLERADDDINSLRAAARKFGSAQEQFPDSPWLRMKRLEVLLDIRKKMRSKKDDLDPLKLGEEAEEQYRSTIEWAEESDSLALRARARMAVIDYLKDYVGMLENAKRSAASTDREVYFEKSIDVAEEKGNDEQAEQYRKDLEKIREERPEKIARYERKLKAARTELCGRLSKLSPEGVEDEAVRKQVDSTKESIDCKALLEGGSDESEKDGQKEGDTE